MAKFNFLNLDEKTRAYMLSEIESDISNRRLFISQRLNELGKTEYPNFLISAVKNSDEEDFEKQLDLNKYFNQTEIRNGKEIKMNSQASKLLCQSEFNRYYIRAICLRALEEGSEEVEIYRARQSSWARPESEAKIGQKVQASELLEDLRNSIGVEPKLFPDINSGLSIKL